MVTPRSEIARRIANTERPQGNMLEKAINAGADGDWRCFPAVKIEHHGGIILGSIHYMLGLYIPTVDQLAINAVAKTLSGSGGRVREEAFGHSDDGSLFFPHVVVTDSHIQTVARIYPSAEFARAIHDYEHAVTSGRKNKDPELELLAVSMSPEQKARFRDDPDAFVENMRAKFFAL